MEPRKTRRTSKVPLKEANGVTASPKPTRKKIKTEAKEAPPIITEEGGDIIIQPDSKPIQKISEEEHFEGLFLPPAIPSQPQAQPQDELQDTDLPEKYATLEQFFNALLSTFLCLKARRQSCTWSNAKEPVQSMCNRTFTLSHVAQMQTVLPGALKLDVWKHTNNKLGDLAIEIISPSSSQPINFSSLAQLQQSFHASLLSIAKKNHTQFLKKKKLKAPASSLYHSSFKNEAVPDIPQATIPSLFDDIKPAPAPAPDAVGIKEEDDSNLTSTKETESHHTTEPKLTKPVPEELAGLSPSIIAAARASEDAELEESEEVRITRRLPTVARGMHHLCVSENKRAFAKKKFLEQMVECAAEPLSYVEAELSLEKIAKIVPQWVIRYKTTDEVEWIRFSRDVPLGTCLSAINKLVQEVVPNK